MRFISLGAEGAAGLPSRPDRRVARPPGRARTDLGILQRMAMMFAALRPACIILRARDGEVAVTDCPTGAGMGLLGAAAGIVMSARQVLLRICPTDPGYGAPVFGLHRRAGARPFSWPRSSPPACSCCSR